MYNVKGSKDLRCVPSEEEGVGAVPVPVAVQGEGGDGYVKHLPIGPLEGKRSPTKGEDSGQR